jgi:hypothetical protein
MIKGKTTQQLLQDKTYHFTVLLCSSTDTGKMLPAFLSLSSLSVTESSLPVGFFKIYDFLEFPLKVSDEKMKKILVLRVNSVPKYNDDLEFTSF